MMSTKAIAFLFVCVFSSYAVSAKSHGTSTESRKAVFISELLIKHPHLADQIWDIGFTVMLNSISHNHSDANSTKMFMNYALDNLPKLLKNQDFTNMVTDVSQEFIGAYDRAKTSGHISVSGNDDSVDKMSHDDVMNVLKHLNITSLILKALKNGKPVFDFILSADSTPFLPFVNEAVKMAPVFFKSRTFQNIRDVVMKELAMGYMSAARDMSMMDMGGQQNTTALVLNVVKHTNMPRLLTELLQAVKPMVDMVTGKDSTEMFTTVGFLAKMYPKLTSSNLYQNVKAVAVDNFWKTFHQLNLTTYDLETNSNDVIKNVIAKTSKLNIIREVLQGSSARHLLSKPTDDSINSKCYSNAMDTLDSLVNMAPWAVKMFDSIGKLSEGVLRGHLNMVGQYDECKTVKAYIPQGTVLGNRTKTSTTSFGTRFCRLSLKVPENMVNLDTKGSLNLRIVWGICVPDSCYSDDIKQLLKLKKSPKLAPVLDDMSVYCSEELSVSDDPSAITAIVILSSFAALVLVGTVVEFIWSHRKIWHKSYYLGQETNTGNVNKAYSGEEVVPSQKVESTQSESETGDANDANDINKVNDVDNDQSIEQTDTNREPKVETIASDLSSNRPEGVQEAFEYQPDKPKGDDNNRKDSLEMRMNTNFVPYVSEESDKYSYPVTDPIDDKHKYCQRGTISTTEKNYPQRKDGLLVKILTAFAIQINTKKLVTGKVGEDAIRCLNGIRVFSISWIIIGHTVNYGIAAIPGLWTTDNGVHFQKMLQRFSFQALYGAPLAVDSFYMMSGMLVIYLQLDYVKRLFKDKNCIKITDYVSRYILHRFWRLTPLYMMIVMILGCLMKYLGDGPLWPDVIPAAENCKTEWWSNLLYINNYLPTERQCLTWGWFLANDMQFYLLTLIFLPILAISFKVGIGAITALMLSGIVSAAYSEHVYGGDLLHSKGDNHAYWTHVYTPPWCRISTYCVGMFLGIIMAVRPKKRFHWMTTLMGWVLSTGIALFLVYIPYTENREGGSTWSVDVNAAYEAVGRPLWAACVAWVVFACYNGCGGIVNTILSWKGFVPLSRLSYAAYLIHPIVMMTFVYSKRTLFYVNDFETIYLVIGHTVVTFAFSFLASLAFESPFMSLEKIVMRR